MKLDPFKNGKSRNKNKKEKEKKITSFVGKTLESVVESCNGNVTIEGIQSLSCVSPPTKNMFTRVVWKLKKKNLPKGCISKTQ